MQLLWWPLHSPNSLQLTGHFPYLYRKHSVARMLVNKKEIFLGVRAENETLRLPLFS